MTTGGWVWALYRGEYGWGWGTHGSARRWTRAELPGGTCVLPLRAPFVPRDFKFDVYPRCFPCLFLRPAASRVEEPLVSFGTMRREGYVGIQACSALDVICFCRHFSAESDFL